MMVSMHASAGARTVQRGAHPSRRCVSRRLRHSRALRSSAQHSALTTMKLTIPKTSCCWCIEAINARLRQAGIQQRPRRIAQQRPRHAAHAPRGQHAFARRPAARAARQRRAGAWADARVYAGGSTAQQPRKAGGPGRQRVAGAGARVGHAHPRARAGGAGALCSAQRHKRQLRAATPAPEVTCRATCTPASSWPLSHQHMEGCRALQAAPFERKIGEIVAQM